ncbi:hypothetical protein XELAEV_18003139mg [Xenopus laevis]|nr:hypothetical protein XELAEV_18003139mg [Xenopus laevis]
MSVASSESGNTPEQMINNVVQFIYTRLKFDQGMDVWINDLKRNARADLNDIWATDASSSSDKEKKLMCALPPVLYALMEVDTLSKPRKEDVEKLRSQLHDIESNIQHMKSERNQLEIDISNKEAFIRDLETDAEHSRIAYRKLREDFEELRQQLFKNQQSGVYGVERSPDPPVITEQGFIKILLWTHPQRGMCRIKYLCQMYPIEVVFPILMQVRVMSDERWQGSSPFPNRGKNNHKRGSKGKIPQSPVEKQNSASIIKFLNTAVQKVSKKGSSQIANHLELYESTMDSLKLSEADRIRFLPWAFGDRYRHYFSSFRERGITKWHNPDWESVEFKQVFYEALPTQIRLSLAHDLDFENPLERLVTSATLLFNISEGQNLNERKIKKFPEHNVDESRVKSNLNFESQPKKIPSATGPNQQNQKQQLNPRQTKPQIAKGSERISSGSGSQDYHPCFNQGYQGYRGNQSYRGYQGYRGPQGYRRWDDGPRQQWGKRQEPPNSPRGGSPTRNRDEPPNQNTHRPSRFDQLADQVSKLSDIPNKDNFCNPVLLEPVCEVPSVQCGPLLKSIETQMPCRQNKDHFLNQQMIKHSNFLCNLLQLDGQYFIDTCLQDGCVGPIQGLLDTGSQVTILSFSYFQQVLEFSKNKQRLTTFDGSLLKRLRSIIDFINEAIWTQVKTPIAFEHSHNARPQHSCHMIEERPNSIEIHFHNNQVPDVTILKNGKPEKNNAVHIINIQKDKIEKINLEDDVLTISFEWGNKEVVDLIRHTRSLKTNDTILVPVQVNNIAWVKYAKLDLKSEASYISLGLLKCITDPQMIKLSSSQEWVYDLDKDDQSQNVIARCILSISLGNKSTEHGFSVLKEPQYQMYLGNDIIHRFAIQVDLINNVLWFRLPGNPEEFQDKEQTLRWGQRTPYAVDIIVAEKVKIPAGCKSFLLPIQVKKGQKLRNADALFCLSNRIQQFGLKEMFAKDSYDCGETNFHVTRIQTDLDAPPVFVKQYRLPLAAYESLSEIIKNLEKRGIIRPVHSSFNHPILGVLKPNGQFRLWYINAGHEFAVFMHKTMPDAAERGTLSYVDDILIKSTTFEEHIAELRYVLKQLEKAGVKLSLQKAQWCRTKVNFLGHEVTAEGINPQEKKVEAIKNMKSPTSLKELTSFLGMMNYSRKFIDNYAELTKPLLQLLKKGATWDWNECHEQAVSELKTKLIQAPCLAYPEGGKPFYVETGFTNKSVSAVLFQKQEKLNKIIAYTSKSLSPVEIKFNNCEKALLATVWALQYFRSFIQGEKIIVETAHQSLQYLQSGRLKDGNLSNSRITAWTMSLMGWLLEIRYKQDNKNLVAEGLAELHDCTNVEHKDVSPENDFLEEQSLSPYKSYEEEYCKSLPCVYVDGCSFHTEEAEKMLDADSDYVRNSFVEYFPGWKRSNMMRSNKKPVKHGKLFCKIDELVTTHGLIIYWKKVRGHSKHPGADKDGNDLVDSLAKKAAINGEILDINDLMGTIQVDITTRGQAERESKPNVPQGPNHRTPLMKRGISMPWSDIQIDFIGPVTTSSKGNRYMLTVIFLFTKWVECLPRAVPRIESDRGSHFTSEVMTKMWEILGVKRKLHIFYRPASSGGVERYNQSIVNILKKFVNESGKDWDVKLPLVLMAIRATPSAATKLSLFEMITGRKMILPQHLLYKTMDYNLMNATTAHQYMENLRKHLQDAFAFAQRNIEKAAVSTKTYYDLKTTQKEYQVHDKVYLYNFTRDQLTASEDRVI